MDSEWLAYRTFRFVPSIPDSPSMLLRRVTLDPVRAFTFFFTFPLGCLAACSSARDRRA